MVVASLGYTRYSIESKRSTEVRARQLASYAMDRLATHAAQNAIEPAAYPDAAMTMTHLRDDLLRNEFSARRRGQIWDQVQRKVESNSNVRSMVREGRHGDMARMWEWIGALPAIEDGHSSGRRQSSRYSLGQLVGSSSSPIKDEDTSEVRHWDEGRPIY